MTDKRIVRIGRYFYKYRAAIAVPFFIMLVICSRPSNIHILPCVSIVGGLLLRIWAAGYIGPRSRKNEFSAEYMIISGPFHYIKHPLYIGNFLLVLGVILLFNPPGWLMLVLLLVFIVEYSIIIYSEEDYLKDLPKKEVKFMLYNSKGEISTTLILTLILLVYMGMLIVLT